MSDESSFVSTVAAVLRRDATLVLPAELLTDVFKYMTTIYPKDKPTSTQEPSYRRYHTRLSWLVVSHVNKRWRYIALTTPSLWSLLYVDMGKSWDTFLERSQPMPLSIEGPCSNHMKARIPSLLGHRHRIRELDLQRISHDLLRDLIAALSEPLLQLTVLSIECQHIDAWSPLLELPTGLFSDTMPNLRKLRLVGLEFPRGIGSRFLTSFEYQAIPLHYDHPAEPLHLAADHCDIVKTIGRMPALRTLRLNLRQLHIPWNIDDEIDTVSLPHLEDVILSIDSLTYWEIWTHLCISPLVRVDIRYDGHTTTLDSLIEAVFDARFKDGPVTRGLSIDARTIQGSLAFELYGPKEGVIVDPPFLALHLSIPSPKTALKELLMQIPLDGIQRLKVHLDGGWEPGFIREIFSPLRSVTHLQLLEEGAMSVCKALLSQNGSTDPAWLHETESENVVLFPALTELHLTDASLTAAPMRQPAVGLPNYAALFCVQEVLKNRLIIGKKLEKLVLTSC